MLPDMIKDRDGNLLALHLIDTGASGGLSHGVHFFTGPNEEFQVGVLNHKAGTVIETHRHNPTTRVLQGTSEVLWVSRGGMEATLYDESDRFVCHTRLMAGDALVLFRGGHGFKVLVDSEIYEFKQGPYAGDKDKTRFTPEDKR